MSKSKWIVITKPNANAKMRLFCFPHAGSGASTYRDWNRQLPAQVEVCAIQLPGRENRIKEAPLTDIESVIDALLPVMLPYLDKPFAFFGHSLGALVAYEMACRLRDIDEPVPLQLFVSGRSAPQSQLREEPYYALPQDDFINKLQGLGGMEDAVLEAPELMAMLLPLLRADFQINELYQYSERAQLDCPISAFRGLKDDLMTYEEVADWKEHTATDFRLRSLPGGHFFIVESSDLLWQILNHDLAQLLNQQRTAEQAPTHANVVA